MPSTRTTQRLVALWEFLRPFAIAASFLLAILIDVIVARTLWGSIHTALIVIICVLLFLPLWLGVYSVFSFPLNTIIGTYMGPTPGEEEMETLDTQAERPRLAVVAGPMRLPSKDANPNLLKAEASLSSGSDLIARRVATSFATWTEIWDSGSGHWFPVSDDLIPPLESGSPLTADEAVRVDDGVPRKEP